MKINDLFSSGPKPSPPVVTKKPMRLPLEDDDKEELPVKPVNNLIELVEL